MARAETHRGVPVMSEGQRLKRDRIGHDPPGVDVAHRNPGQRARTSRSAPANRVPTPTSSNPRSACARFACVGPLGSAARALAMDLDDLARRGEVDLFRDA